MSKYLYPHPVTGKLVSRQRISQIKAEEAGMCRYHIKIPSVRGGLCQKCLDYQHRWAGSKRHYPPKEAWTKVDWSRPIAEIASELNVTVRAAQFQRRKHTSK